MTAKPHTERERVLRAELKAARAQVADLRVAMYALSNVPPSAYGERLRAEIAERDRFEAVLFRWLGELPCYGGLAAAREFMSAGPSVRREIMLGLIAATIQSHKELDELGRDFNARRRARARDRAAYSVHREEPTEGAQVIRIQRNRGEQQ